MDPVTITTSVLAIGGFTLKSCVTLLDLIRGFRSQNKDARALKAEVGDLILVLEALLETIAGSPNVDFESLRVPLLRCGNACDEYAKLVERCTKHSSETSRSSVRDWVTQKYLQGDINDFKQMLASYKSTINIALANANLRIAAITPQVLEDYKDMICDATSDLDTHLQEIEQKINRLESGNVSAIEDLEIEWNAMLEEKESTQRGLEMCAQLSARIREFESESESAEPGQEPSPRAQLVAHKHIRSGLGDVKGSIESLVKRLQAHEAALNRQLQATSSSNVSEPIDTQLVRLRETKESISQCIQVVSEAEISADERCNVFEDITMADNSYALSVSTVNDLVVARRLNLKDRSRHFGGQVTDETVQKTIVSLTDLDREFYRLGVEPSGRDSPKPTPEGQADPVQGERFTRFGRGMTLSTNKQ